MKRQYSGRQTGSPSGTVMAQRVVDVIEKRFAERLTVKSVAAAVRVNAARVDRAFQGAIGLTIHEYLTQVRLEHAASLIRSNVKIEAVALDVGYQSKKNFYRQFARRFGVTPEAFRRTTPSGPPKVPTRHGVKTYAATFDGVSCLIEIELRNNIKGRDSYVATPLVVVEHGVQPFAATSDHVQMAGGSEGEALELAAIFLEHRFGSRTTAPKPQRGVTNARLSSRP
jgi:AraC-like DNA-binding protein